MEPSGIVLYRYCCYVLHGLYMAGYNTVMPGVFRDSYGTRILDHLAADGAGFAGGQVTVVAVGQVDAHFLCSLHLELVHGFLSLGNIDPVVIGIAHIHSLLLIIFGKQDTFRIGEHLFFRGHSLTKVEMSMSDK